MDEFFIIQSAVKAGVVVLAFLLVLPVMIWLERRGSAWMQLRLGPNRVGPFGFFHALADVVKMLFKEDRIPGHVHSFYYNLAPILSIIPAFMTFAVVPFASSIMIDGKQVIFQVANLDVGILYIFAIGSLGVYGIMMAGWSSNNKYSILGGVRSSAQMISYELSMGLSIIGILMVFESLNLNQIAQGSGETLIQIGSLSIPKWGFLIQPLGFFVFLCAVFAETNRLPFDLPEGESEIVAGYHLEYGAMRFGLFMMAEYMNMTTASALVVALFFGGWQFLPGFSFILESLALDGMAQEWARVLLEALSFVIKTAFFLWFFIWVRWTLPRFRFDQVMQFGWKVMLPLSLLNLVVTSLLIFYGVL